MATSFRERAPRAAIDPKARVAAAARQIRASLVLRVLDILGDRWALLILAALLRGPARFDQLQQRLHIARSTLARRLDELAADGLVERRPYRNMPARQAYALTDCGRDAAPIVHAIRNWDRVWAPAESRQTIDEPARRLVCRHCLRPIVAREVAYHSRNPSPGTRRVVAAPRLRRSRNGAERPSRIGSAADIHGNRSLALVVAAPFFGLRRFNDIETALNMASNVLTRALDDLVAAGLLARRLYSERPPRADYVLTDKGRDIYPILVAEIAWAERWLAGRSGSPLVLRHVPCGRQLVPVLEPERPSW